MCESNPRFLEIFFEVYESLPRQGPGNRACAEKALALCLDLPKRPAVLDLGCGVGGQTLNLADLIDGSIVAVDRHTRSIDRLRATVAKRELGNRITPVVGDMARLEMPARRFDLIWSEGALYNLGIANALEICHELLTPGGYLAFTDAVWQTNDPPPEVKASFDLDYPTMGHVQNILTAIEQSKFQLEGHFTLPDEAWWDDFYTPMESRIEALKSKHAHDAEAMEVLEQIASEPSMHRRYSDHYAYVFFVVRR